MTYSSDAYALDWSKSDGLVPAIIQDVDSLRVLMLGYINKESLEQTIETGFVTFFSRSKKRLWQKGETSGHVLRLRDIRLDCDHDTLLILVEPTGPTCHLGTETCFGELNIPTLSVMSDLTHLIHQRRIDPEAQSYTSSLFADGITRIAQKVGEEGVETALAAATGSPGLPEEAADLLYHLLVLLEASGVGLSDVMAVLMKRAQKKEST